MATSRWSFDPELSDTTILLGTGESQKTLLASSHMLSLASKTWRSMLTTSAEHDGKFLRIPTGNVTALIIILELVHHQYDNLDDKLTATELIEIAYLAKTYSLRAFLRKKPYQDCWDDLPHIVTFPGVRLRDDVNKKPFWLKIMAIQILGRHGELVSALKEFMIHGVAPGQDKDFVESEAVEELRQLFMHSPTYSKSYFHCMSELMNFTNNEQKHSNNSERL